MSHSGSKQMKTAVFRQYGTPDVIEHRQRPIPTPQANEILVKMVATSANVANLVRMTGKPHIVRLFEGLSMPKYPAIGMDIAGWVEAVGSEVTEFKRGDAVFGSTATREWGSFAEYTIATEETLAHKPDNISFEEAAAVPNVGYTAVQGLRAAGMVQAGQQVLINGASGGVGTMLVQLVKALGGEITAVCSHRHVERLYAIGANHVIDYTKEDFTQNGRQYDLIIGANGYQPLLSYKRSLKPNGVYVCTGGAMPQVFQSMLLGPLVSLFGKKRLFNMGVAKVDKEDLRWLKSLLEDGEIKPTLDRCYPFSRTMEAFHYLNEGHAQGKVIVMAGE
ncbi:MAG: NAD(P)-dependent alcohol dehydrogenase [Chloroflexota bacterium]